MLATIIPIAVTGIFGVAVTVLVHEASELLAVSMDFARGAFLALTARSSEALVGGTASPLETP